MEISDLDLKKLNDDGFILKKNILSNFEINKIRHIILNCGKEGKGGNETYFPSNFIKLLIKSMKLDFNKTSAGLFFLSLKKKLNLDVLANKFFNKKSRLLMIDGYYNKKTDIEILPWHSDQSYSGAKSVKNIKSPDFYFLKFFFYLTEVGSNNGCTSYIPNSHKITYAVRSCLFNREIEYEPFWSLKDLINLIKKKKNYEIIKKKLNDDKLLDDFLIRGNNCINNKLFTDYDFHANPGDVLIFNETGIHKGSNPSNNDRIVLRYLYSKI